MATLESLLQAAQGAQMRMSGDRRVKESDAAILLGINSEYLKQIRGEGKGPRNYGRGVDGSRVSYRLDDLAEWIESGAGER